MTPQSYGVALALTILTMLCWGSWANTLKIAKGWRFELLYYDYSIGVALCALVAGLTFGMWDRRITFASRMIWRTQAT